MPPTSRSGRSSGPGWVVRWNSPFGIVYLGRDPQRESGRGYSLNGKVMQGFRSKIVHEVEKAWVYQTRERAEDAAFKLTSQHPEELMGKLEPREWDGKKKRP